MHAQALTALLLARPHWFEISSFQTEAIVGTARVEQTIWRQQGVRLQIKAGAQLEVAEELPGTFLPSRCAERHIQTDHTFCLGLRPIQVADSATAFAWWDSLRQFLWLQSVAAQTRVWPAQHYLDHGQAGFFHEAALEVAEKLNLLEEYEVAYEGGPSWITDAAIRLADKQGRPINGRASCPKGCRSWRKGNAILRRDCPKREGLALLSHYERRRRLELTRYWEEELTSGVVCCGSMRDCPLRRKLTVQFS